MLKEKIMANMIEDVTINYVENDITIVKEIDKAILTRGAWATVIFKYKEWQAKNQSYSQDKFSIRRYQKRNGVYQQRSKFNISNQTQAQQLIDILQNWLDDDEDDN